ncbi:hypothetical protein L226DRAFT_574725 [Lentinus tigrinus ALCF2SS1-7]|uniref:Uncharacterized protein n=1 Tax=Lentinus tigrinus ALCF2SS1-6 TaxID=1328759 RepID=A0A5C2S368_9APHY|nr:hypothetical protein L227DRAFT_613293 [Lentinus tigrinus ALCF2SS1-6]RPD70393.1 hypothetical protein L226DRAFT_574725 [Lentinus tigrinus ALCF2SS1-7]
MSASSPYYYGILCLLHRPRWRDGRALDLLSCRLEPAVDYTSLSPVIHSSNLISMGNCPRCDALIDKEHFPKTDSHSYGPGDIIGIQDSVHVPIYDHVLNNRARQPSSRRGSNLSTGSRIWVDNGRGGRPAVVLERRPIESKDGKEETVVLLLATYEGDYHLRSSLPLVLQIFCIAVYPHSTIEEDEAGVFHLHTSPEWSHSRKDADNLHGWLIARQFTSTRKTTGRWLNANRSDRDSQSTFTIDHATRIKLLEIIEEKWDQWLADCDRDPQRLYRYREDYKNFRDKVLKYSTTTSPARTQNATPTARSPPAGSPTARSPPGLSSRAWTPGTSNPTMSFAQAAGTTFQQNTTAGPKPAEPASNGSARPTAQPPSTSRTGPSPRLPVTSSSPRPSAPQGAQPGVHTSAPPVRVGNGSAVPSSSRPPSATASGSTGPIPQAAQSRSAAPPSQPPSYAQVLREKAAARGAGQHRPSRN